MKDQFEREISYLRISITDLCNLRCRYCMPDGVCQKDHRAILSFEEIQEITSAAAELGVRKVRITGGEPLVRRGCVELCRMISGIPGIQEVDLTTNGILLPRYARDLKEAGVNRVNISLDTMDPEKYAYITGGGSLMDAMDGIQAAFDAGLTPVKVNTVLIGGFNDAEIPAFVAMTRETPVELRFIELMPMGGEFGKEAYLPGKIVLDRVPELKPLPENGGVARLYRLPGGAGRIGLISPLSRHFCGTCNRLRLTSEGSLKPCLHSGQEIPVRGKHGGELKETLRQAIYHKPQMHGILDADHPSEAGRAMNTIGG
ncbi:MAG: GTP 3',8-cyclase MoaA [Oscillospiraceae bacterium]|nr:GTP 3',8-cyclase MoaA [Oscillospiraceae bacterium]